MEDRLRDRPATHHVHVDDRAKTLPPARAARGTAPACLPPPPATRSEVCVAGAGQSALTDRLRQRAGRLRESWRSRWHCRSRRALVIEMAAVDDLLVAQHRIRARYRRCHHVVRSRMPRRAHDRMQPDALSRRQPLLQRSGLLERDHERERVEGRKAVQMPPAHKVLIFRPPRGALVLRITHDSHGTEALHRQRRHRPRLGRRQHDAPAHIPARVIAFTRARAHIDQVRRRIRTVTVLRQRHRHVIEAGNANSRLPPTPDTATRPRLAQLPQLREFRVPRRPRLLRAIERVPIRRNLVDRDLRQPVHPQLTRNEIRRRPEPARATHAMVARYELQIALRHRPRNLARNRLHRTLPQQLSTAESAEGTEKDQRIHRIDSHCSSEALRPGRPSLSCLNGFPTTHRGRSLITISTGWMPRAHGTSNNLLDCAPQPTSPRHDGRESLLAADQTLHPTKTLSKNARSVAHCTRICHPRLPSPGWQSVSVSLRDGSAPRTLRTTNPSIRPPRPPRPLR